jgi:hypothetical protein
LRSEDGRTAKPLGARHGAFGTEINHKQTYTRHTEYYRVGNEKVAHLPFAFAVGYCIISVFMLCYGPGLQTYTRHMEYYRVGKKKVARLPFAFAFGYCINFCNYATLRTRATFSWPILYLCVNNYKHGKRKKLTKK